MLVRGLSELGEQFAKASDLFKFLTLLSFGELPVIQVLNAAGCVDAHGLQSASG